MKKKALATVLACVLAATMLAGCSGSDSSSTATTAAAAAEAAEEAAPAEDAAAAETEAAPAADTANLSEVQQIIKQAESMTMEELAQKAIEESNGATFYGVGNSSRGATALPLFIEYLQTIDPSYDMDYEWQQPKNN